MMLLVEAGKVRISDRVNEYLPEFAADSPITVRHLMTHFSGLRPDVDIEPAWSGYDTGIKRALAEKPMTPPGVRFIYSDINFILLGEIVRRVSGQTLPEFTTKQVFGPLGMKETMFLPPASLRPRIAPTERLEDGTVLRGVVHDPTSRYMGGVAGHAGLFSTGDDLGRFADMLLGGAVSELCAFSALTVEKMSTPQSPRTIRRCAAWGGTSVRPMPRIVASCCRWDPSATPGSPGLHCGSTRPPNLVLLLAIAMTRTAGRPSSASARGWPRLSRRRCRRIPDRAVKRFSPHTAPSC
jgi:CubicO group peptidase (beta-lactamase class C family)